MASMLKAGRKRGLSAADLAKQDGVSMVCIYTPPPSDLEFLKMIGLADA